MVALRVGVQALRVTLIASAIAGCPLISGCGGAQVRDRGTRAPETFVVKIGESVSIDGEDLHFVGLSPGEREGDPYAASLSRTSGGSIDVAHPGCTREGSWVYSLEALDAGDEGWARFARSRASAPPRSIAWGEPIEIGPGETLSAPDGWTYSLGELRADHPSVWILEVIGEREGERIEQAIDAQAEGARESALDSEHLVTAWTTDRTDAMGCPVVRIAIDKPGEHVADAVSGAWIEVPPGAGIRVGATVIRLEAWGEERLEGGTDVGLALLSLERAGAERTTTMCRTDEACVIDGFSIEVRGGASDGLALRATPAP